MLLPAKTFLFMVLTFFSLTTFAKGASPFTLLTPNPVEGENIQIYYYGCDTPVANLFTGDFFYTEQNGDEINLVVSMGPGLPLCNIQYDYYYDLGQFSEGNYEIKVYVTTGSTPHPINLNEWIGATTDFFNINVQEAQPTATPIPSSNFWGLFGLIVSVMLLTLLTYKHRDLS